MAADLPAELVAVRLLLGRPDRGGHWRGVDRSAILVHDRICQQPEGARHRLSAANAERAGAADRRADWRGAGAARLGAIASFDVVAVRIEREGAVIITHAF